MRSRIPAFPEHGRPTTCLRANRVISAFFWLSLMMFAIPGCHVHVQQADGSMKQVWPPVDGARAGGRLQSERPDRANLAGREASAEPDRPSFEFPAFVTRDYPYADTATAIVKPLTEPTHLREWGFQDLVAPAGTRVVKMRFFRSRVVLENPARVFGGKFWYTGDVAYENRLKKALDQEHARGGCPMIIATAYFTSGGRRVESLPITVEYYGGMRRGRLDGLVSPFKLDRELLRVINSSSPPRVDPEDPRFVFMYAGMASNAGFDGMGYFVPIRLTDANSSWASGFGYFGHFRSGRLVSKTTLESFGGPLALKAQEEARERGEIMSAFAGMTLLGGLAVMTGGVISLGEKTWDLYKEGVALQARQSGLAGESGRAVSPQSSQEKVRAAYVGGGKKDFHVIWHGSGIANHELLLKDVVTGFRMWVEYHGPTGLFAGDALQRDGVSIKGTTVNVLFARDGTPAYVARDALGSGNSSCSINSYHAR